MSLAQILLPPPTEQGMEEFMFAHYQHHLAINEGLRARGYEPAVYQIYPVNMADKRDVQRFLDQHQQWHNDFESLLGLQGFDLSGVDFEDQKQSDAWSWLNLNGHRNAALTLNLTF